MISKNKVTERWELVQDNKKWGTPNSQSSASCRSSTHGRWYYPRTIPSSTNYPTAFIHKEKKKIHQLLITPVDKLYLPITLDIFWVSSTTSWNCIAAHCYVIISCVHGFFFLLRWMLGFMSAGSGLKHKWPCSYHVPFDNG